MNKDEEQPPIDADSMLSVSTDEDVFDNLSLSADSIAMSDEVRDYVYENSRRYHKYQEGRYHFPNDDAEQEREDLQHAMFTLLCDGKLHFAPLDNPRSILDIGTGTGIWAIEMGDEYPDAEILGIDLSPIQPLWVPRNVQFMVDNVEEEWLQPAGSLDYVHARQMASTIRDWPALMAEVFKALKPGGWFELQDLKCGIGCDDDTLREDNAVADFLDKIAGAMKILGVDCLGALENYERWLREAGFVNVKKVLLKAPVGTWPKDPQQSKIGLYSRNMMYDGLHGFAIRPFTHGFDWTPEEVEVYLVNVRKAVLRSKAHIYIPFHCIYAQKPPEPAAAAARSR